MPTAVVRCFTSQKRRLRRLLAVSSVVALPSCVVYTPDLLNDDSVSIGGRSNPTASPAAKPSPSLPPLSASSAPAAVDDGSRRFLAAPRVNPATDSVELAAAIADAGADETVSETWSASDAGPDAN